MIKKTYYKNYNDLIDSKAPYKNYNELVDFYANVFDAFISTMHEEEEEYLSGAKTVPETPDTPTKMTFEDTLVQIFTQCLKRKKKELVAKEAEKKMREKREADAREAAKVKEVQRQKDEQAIKDLINKYNKDYTADYKLFNTPSKEEVQETLKDLDTFLKEIFDIIDY